MFGVGMPELLVIFVIALLVFGPKKLPELARSLGQALSYFKRASDDFRDTIQSEMDAIEEEERRKAMGLATEVAETGSEGGGPEAGPAAAVGTWDSPPPAEALPAGEPALGAAAAASSAGDPPAEARPTAAASQPEDGREPPAEAPPGSAAAPGPAEVGPEAAAATAEAREPVRG